MRKRKRKNIKKQVDKLVSDIVRARDPRCVLCGSVHHIQNGHLFSRTFMGARFDIQLDGNCHTQCAVCNRLHNLDPLPYLRWYEKMFGSQKLEDLRMRAKRITKVKTFELLDMVVDLKAYLKNQSWKSEPGYDDYVQKRNALIGIFKYDEKQTL